MTEVTLGAPLAGWLAALGEVPDPVFADGMMGAGFAIDPLDGRVCAPADATVVSVAPTAHSVTLRLANGAELLIHVGIDTVAMNGRGMRALVSAGDRVAAGAALLQVDLDAMAREATSAMTPVVVTGDGFAIEQVGGSRPVAAGDPVATVRAIGSAATESVTGQDTARCVVVVPLATGIHARPAARIVAALKPFAARVTIERGETQANARSVVSLLTAAIAHGDEIAIVAQGEDARAAVTAVGALIEGGMGETEAAVPAPSPTPGGVRAAPGFAVGPAFPYRVPDQPVADDAPDAAGERAALDRARASVRAAIGDGEIGAAHRALVDDPELVGAAEQGIAAGRSAGHAWRAASRTQEAALRASGNALLAERAADLLDVERQIVAALLGTAAATPDAPAGAIVLADELLPSDVMALATRGVAGLATAYGGPTSHAAILAASAGLPMVVALGRALIDVPAGRTVILDADAGRLVPDPDAAALAAAHQLAAERAARRAAEREAAHVEAATRDGARIEVVANLGNVADAAAAVAAGADGCGLLRTEFLFMDRATAPGEAEQRDAYAAIAAALDGRPLIVRTLDVGGDKPLAYLPFAPEENPALGPRGIRFSLAHPELLRTQLRAILAGVPAPQRRIMLPMVVDAGEIARARAILNEAAASLGIDDPGPLGVMVETPAAAVLAASLAREADFLSVGSNDLTQYALAADRGNPAVAAMIDALHPAVLRLIALAGEGAAAHGRWLGVCGGIASDPDATALLIGLGVTELSAAPAAVPAIKAAVRRVELAAARDLAARALACATAAEVRALVRGARA